MLPDPNVFKEFALDASYAVKVGWLNWRIARKERKIEKLRLKRTNLA